MPDRSEIVSLAIETTCSAGGVAMGVGDALIEVIDFDASRRAATQVVGRLDDLLRRHGHRPADVGELYVAVGPGSFTGTRVGVTVARTLGQAIPSLRCVCVPTAPSVAEGVEVGSDEHLAVVLDARRKRIWTAMFDRRGDRWVPVGEGEISTVELFLANAPRPLCVVGEGLGYFDLSAPGVTVASKDLWLPRVPNVWRVGRRMASAGRFTEYLHVLPLYTDQPEAVRLWEERSS